MTAFDPRTYTWAANVSELLVSDIEASRTFWCGVLGFRVAYERPEQGFLYLDRDGAQVMLCQRSGEWETAALEAPFGRGVNLQMTVSNLGDVLAALYRASVALYEGPYVRWRRAGHAYVGARECLVQDPDGYLLRFSERLGVRDTP